MKIISSYPPDMTYEEYKEILPSLPTDPGIYRFWIATTKLFMLGKPKFKNRIVSYFGDKNIRLPKPEQW